MNPEYPIGYDRAGKYARPLRPPVTLSDGTVLRHRFMDNGAQEVYIDGSASLTESQWDEYCDRLRHRATA